MAKSNFKKTNTTKPRTRSKVKPIDKKDLGEYVDCLRELHKLQGVLLANLSKHM